MSEQEFEEKISEQEIQPEENQELDIDEAMLEMSDFIGQMNDMNGYLISEEGEFALYADKVMLDLPIQMDIQMQENGKVKIGSSPPLYYVETTIMPVFHQVRIKMEINTDQT